MSRLPIPGYGAVTVGGIPKEAADPRPRGLRLSLHRASNGIALTAADARAWYRLARVRWNWLVLAQQAQAVNAAAFGYTGLVGRAFHLRLTSQPYGAHEWARNYVRTLAERGIRPPDEEGFYGDLEAAQWAMLDADMSEPAVYLGVHLENRRALDRTARKLHYRQGADREMARLRTTVRALDEVLARPGLGGRRLGNAEFGWLMHRSAGLGLPERIVSVNAPYEPEDMWQFVDGVAVYPERRHKLARVVGSPDRCGTDRPVERWVAVLAMGRTDELLTPGVDPPWVAHSASLDFPVEWSIRAVVESGARARERVQRKVDLFDDQLEQYVEIDKKPPRELAIVAERAEERLHEMSEGDEVRAASVKWWARLAVAGQSPGEVREMVRDLTAHYAPKVEIEHPGDQVALCREFVPGEPQANRKHMRQGNPHVFAAGMPTITSSLGDKQGIPGLTTVGPHPTPAPWDPFRALYQTEQSGFTPLLGDSGCGKSTLGAHFIRWMVKAGVSVSVLDPAGTQTLARLARLPDLAPHSLVINAMDARPSSFSPYVVVADPPREAFYDDPEARGLEGADLEGKVDDLWKEAKATAEQTRRNLAIDVLLMMCDPEDLTRPVRQVIRRAVSVSPAGRVGSLNQVLVHMRQMGSDGEEAAAIFQDLSTLRVPAKFFGSGYLHENKALLDRPLLIITLDGASLPEKGGKPRTRQQREHVPLLHLAAHVLESRVYTRPMLEPKAVWVDEKGMLTGWNSGDEMTYRWAANSRKWRTRFLVGTHSLDAFPGNVRNLIEDVFVGRTTLAETAASALPALRIQPKAGYEEALARLSPRLPNGAAPDYRDFLVRLDGDVEQVRLHIDRELRAATTPGAPMPGDPEWRETAA